jgi:hypothetical protein
MVTSPCSRPARLVRLRIGEDHYDLLDEVRTTVPRGDAVFDLAGYRRSNAQPHIVPVGTSEVLVFLRDAEPLKDRLDAIGAKPLRTSEGAGFLVPEAFPNTAVFDDIHARDLCLGCFFDYQEESDIAEHGLYHFTHAEDWISGPYALVTRPDAPVKVDELPADVTSRRSYARARPKSPRTQRTLPTGRRQSVQPTRGRRAPLSRSASRGGNCGDPKGLRLARQHDPTVRRAPSRTSELFS